MTDTQEAVDEIYEMYRDTDEGPATQRMATRRRALAQALNVLERAGLEPSESEQESDQ